MRGDLIRILEKLGRRRDRFDHILIETTGLADPGPVVQTFFMDAEMQEKFLVNGVITLVDAKHAVLHLEDSAEMQAQIAFTDRIILEQYDLVGTDEATALENCSRRMNALATVVRSVRANVPVAELLALGGFHLDHAMEIIPQLLAGGPTHEEHAHGHHEEQDQEQKETEEAPRQHHHSHDDTVTTVAWTMAESAIDRNWRPGSLERFAARGRTFFG